MESLTSVVILFVYMFLGWGGRRTLLSADMMVGLNRFVYYFAVPALLFHAGSELALSELFQPLPLAALLVASLLTAVITIAVCRSMFRCRDGAGLTARALNATFANYAYMGIPVVTALLGDDGYGPMIAIILTGNLVVIGTAQVCLQSFGEAKGTAEQSLWQRTGTVVVESLLKSPVFLSTVAGLLFSHSGLVLPDIANQVVISFGGMTVPLALFCLGAGLSFRPTGASSLELGWLILLKLFVHPALTWGVLILFGVTGSIWPVALVVMTSLPTGALAYVVTAHYGRFAEETTLVITLSSLLSLLTLPLWIALTGAG